MMQEPFLLKQRQAYVSFTYGSFPSQLQRSLEKHQEPQAKRISNLSLRPRAQTKIEIKAPQTTKNHENSQVHTLKKQAEPLELDTTTRKSFIPRIETEEAQSQMLDFSRVNSSRMSEVTLLKEQIKFMRGKLSQAETAYKDVRLQFQLYKARIEKSEDSCKRIVSLENVVEQDGSRAHTQHLQGVNTELSQNIRKAQLKIADLQKKLQNQTLHLYTVQQSQKSQLQSQEQKLLQMKQHLQQKQQEILRLHFEADTIREQSTASTFRFSNQLRKLELQKQRLSSQLSEEKETRKSIQYRLQQAEKEAAEFSSKANQLSNHLEQRMKDIDFLNQQSYQLDTALKDAYSEIDTLRTQLTQRQEGDSSELILKKIRDKSTILEQNVFAWEGEIQRLALTVYDLRGNYERSLQKVTEEVNTVEQFKTKCQQLEEEKQRLQFEQSQQMRKNMQHLSHLEGELARLRGQNLHLRAAIDKLQSNERVLLKELDWFRQQRKDSISDLQRQYQQRQQHYQAQIQRLKTEASANRLRQVEEIKQLQQKLNHMTARYSELTQRYQQNLNSVIHNYQTRLKREQLEGSCKQIDVGSNRSIESGAGGNSLSKEELKKYIQAIKSQPENTEQDHLRLKEEVEALQEQMQFIKTTYDQAIQDMKNKYQREINNNKLEFQCQLNSYRDEIEALRQEIAQMRGEHVEDHPVEIIEEESEEYEEDSEIDQGKVRKDLMMHVADPSDFYVSPPSTTPVKAICPQVPKSDESNYMLQDIIDLQSKIHSYIKNFNKKRSPEMQDVQ